MKKIIIAILISFSFSTFAIQPTGNHYACEAKRTLTGAFLLAKYSSDKTLLDDMKNPSLRFKQQFGADTFWIDLWMIQMIDVVKALPYYPESRRDEKNQDFKNYVYSNCMNS